MANSGFDEFVRTARFAMSINGIWPGTDFHKHWYLRYQFLLPVFLMLFFIIIPQTTMLVSVWGELNLVLEILTTADIIVGLACIKLLGIWYHKKTLQYLLIEIEKQWKSVRKDHEPVMWKNVKMWKLIVTVYTCLTYGSVVLYATSMLVVLRSHMAVVDTSNTTTSMPMFLNSKFFFETDYSPTFEIIWICQFISCILGAGAFTSFDGLFMFSIFHLSGQLINLQIDLSKSIDQSRDTERCFVYLLKSFVERHIHLYKFTYCIEDNFNKIFLIQMIYYSVILCLQGYQFVIISNDNTDNKTTTVAFFLIYTTGNITSLFLYCFVAEILRQESTNVFVIAYEINWYELQPKESIMLLNVMHAAKMPFQITAGKFAALSFEYFMTVLKTSAGYLSMLLAVKTSLN